ncbi:MAG: EAL domain-containing protein [Spirochaetales bacterium]|nr:EAL domain-containing protein [Spirochaetales bacterium]
MSQRAVALSPPLTTVSQPLYRMGKEAVNLLMGIFNGKALPQKMILQTRLVVRRSCGCWEEEWTSHSCLGKNIESPAQNSLSPEQSIVRAMSDKADNGDYITRISGKELKKWVHSLLEAFKKGCDKKEFPEFTLVLDAMFNELRNRNQDTRFWNILINALCDYVKSSVQNTDDQNLLDNLRAHVFEMLGKAINRSKEYENITFQEQSIELYRISQELLTGFKMDSMKKVILERIPRIGLRSCYIALYKIDDYNETNQEYSRLVVAYPRDSEAEEPEDKGYYLSYKIIPGTLKRITGVHTYIIMPINFKNEMLGYGVYEHGSENFLVYENFVVQLSSVLKEIQLIEQKIVQTQKLEQEVKVSVTALEKTTHQLNAERDERKKTEEALRTAQEQALITLKSIGDGVITTDTRGIITYLNPVAEELTGWQNIDAIGKPLGEVFKVVYRFSDLLVEHPIDIALNNKSGFKISGSIILKNKYLHEYEIEESISPIRNFNDSVTGVVIIIRNVSETQRMTRELFYQRTHDQLTGLINRIRFEELIKETFEGLLTEKNEHCLCFLDIDSFRIINDACGHAAGDELIKKVASLLRSCVRQSDVLSRLGGDQFGLLLISCPFSRAKELAESILSVINRYTFVWKGTNYQIRMSIGLVYIDTYSENISHALTAVNFACCLAKKKGGNQLHIYNADDEDSVKYQSEMQYIPYITKAIKEGRFCLYKQVIRPIGYGIPDNDHYEILIRMKDDDGNLISPVSFLQIAERYNLMPEIDRWVVEKLFSSYKVDYYETPDKAYAKYSINISGVTLNDEKFLHFIIDKLNQYRIPPYMICFEITETAAISNFTQVILFIKELKKIGCFFSLDDFGSGWASFNYLKVLPVDFLKIDGSFVKEITRNPLDYVLVQTMNHIGHVIGLKTIAEYVENDDIIDRLKKIGVDYAQGYGISKPEPFFI